MKARRSLGFLELELQAVVRVWCRCWIWNFGLWKNSKCSYLHQPQICSYDHVSYFLDIAVMLVYIFVLYLNIAFPQPYLPSFVFFILLDPNVFAVHSTLFFVWLTVKFPVFPPLFYYQFPWQIFTHIAGIPLKLFIFILWVCVSTCMCVCTQCICLVPIESRRWHWISHSWYYRWLWGTMCMLGMESRSSARSTSSLNHWHISSAPTLLILSTCWSDQLLLWAYLFLF